MENNEIMENVEQVTEVAEEVIEAMEPVSTGAFVRDTAIGVVFTWILYKGVKAVGKDVKKGYNWCKNKYAERKAKKEAAVDYSKVKIDEFDEGVEKETAEDNE